jgi:hypothetical protein
VFGTPIPVQRRRIGQGVQQLRRRPVTVLVGVVQEHGRRGEDATVRQVVPVFAVAFGLFAELTRVPAHGHLADAR